MDSRFVAVCLDFSDTLFWRDGSARIVLLASEAGVVVRPSQAEALWNGIRAASNTTEELAKRRDSSAEAHRACWTELYRAVDVLAPELEPLLSERLYEDQRNPAGWHAYLDTVELLGSLQQARIPVAVVSDVGWDIRRIFRHHEVEGFVSSWVLSFDYGTEKPDPLLFLTACRELGSSPARTLMVGDSVQKDGGAASAGLTALVLPQWSGSGPRGLMNVLSLVGS